MCSNLSFKLEEILGNDGVFLYPSHSTPAPYHGQALIKPVNFSCIGIFQTAKSYLEAYNFCANLDSHLVEIFTVTQQDFLKAKLMAKFVNRRSMHFWIGVKFNGVNWYWEHSNTGLKFNGFQDCYDGPPDCIDDYNDAENAEPYAHMDQEKGYKWDDEDEDDANTYPICQYND